MGRGAAIGFEAAGAQASLDATLACLRKGGEAVLVGLMGEARVDVFDIVNRELRPTTSVGYRDVYPTLIEWTARDDRPGRHRHADDRARRGGAARIRSGGSSFFSIKSRVSASPAFAR